MGYETMFDGQISVVPPLNKSEIAYLTGFAESRRIVRTKGPYHVQGGGFAGQGMDPDIVDYNKPPEDQPGLWCHWLPTEDGTAIVEEEECEKFYDADQWMRYLIVTFLQPDAAVARELRDPVPGRVYPEEFADFTFDHVLNGVIEAQGEFKEDVWRLIVRDNAVYYQDGARDSAGRITYEAPEVLVTPTEGRPPM